MEKLVVDVVTVEYEGHLKSGGVFFSKLDHNIEQDNVARCYGDRSDYVSRSTLQATQS